MQTNNYPTKKVILSYTLLGGLTGGVVFIVSAGLYMLIEQAGLHGVDTSLNAIKSTLVGVIAILIVSCLVGIIPAFLTGLVIAKTRTHWQIMRLFSIGAVLSLVTSFALMAVFGMFVFHNFGVKQLLDALRSGVIFALLGGLSAVIIGKCVLPKR